MERRRQRTGALATAIVVVTWVLGGAALWAREAPVSDGPALLFVQGRLKPGAEDIYQRYVEGTGPLLAAYGARVVAVGTGVESDTTTGTWPINAVLSFPNHGKAEGFLRDPRYLEIKPLRDAAYETLHLSLVEGRAPRVRTPKQVAEEAFADFRHGLGSGDWQPFLDRLSDDFTLRFPYGTWQGTHHGKAKAAAFFDFFNQAYPEGLTITELERVTAEGDRVVFEFTDEGKLRDQPYRNHVAISLDVCGERICGYREYFGLVGPPPPAPAGEKETGE